MGRKRFVHNIPSQKEIRFRNRFSHPIIDQIRNDGTSRESSYPILNEDNDEMDLDYNNDNYDEMVRVSSSEGLSEGSNSDDDDNSIEGKSSSSGGSSEGSNDDDDVDVDDNSIEESNDDDDNDDDDNSIEEKSSSSGGSSEGSNDDDDNNNNNSIEEKSSSSGGSSEGSNNDDDDEYYQIVDEALNETKMPYCNINNVFAPYFENFTTASMFCWLQKHNISTSAYEDLTEIICNPQFNPTHVVKNVRRFRT
jgi:hypothetical protein